MKKLEDGKLLTEALEKLRKHVEVSNFPEPLFRCRYCEDTGFVVHRGADRRMWGRRCDCLVREVADHKASQPTSRRARPGDDVPF